MFGYENSSVRRNSKRTLAYTGCALVMIVNLNNTAAAESGDSRAARRGAHADKAQTRTGGNKSQSGPEGNGPAESNFEAGESGLQPGRSGTQAGTAALEPGVGTFQPGSYVEPSLFVREEYMDNIFSTYRRPQSDFVTRATPALTAQYASPSVVLGGRYSITGAHYVRHSGLDSAAVAQTAAGHIAYAPSARWILGLRGAHATTHRPNSFVPETGLQLGRYKASINYVLPSVSYVIDPLTTGTVSGQYQTYKLEGRGEIVQRRGTLNVVRDITRRDSVGVNYYYGWYRFSNRTHLVMQSLSVGWARDITQNLTVSLRAGPRLTASTWSPQYYASLHYGVEHGGLSLSWLKTKTVVLGETGAVDLQRATISGRYAFTKDFGVRIAPTYVVDKFPSGTLHIYQMNALLAYRLSDNVSVVAAYQYNLERGAITGGTTLGLPAPGATPGSLTSSAGREIRRDIAYLGFVFTFGGPPSSGPLGATLTGAMQSFGTRSSFATPGPVNPQGTMGALVK